MMQDINQEALQELCEKIDLLEYAQTTMNFEKRGNDWFAHCPSHVDNTPSLSITPSKNVWYCHSCHKGGGIIAWMMNYENMSFKEAVEKVLVLSGGDINSLKICDAMAFYQEVKKVKTEEPLQDVSQDREVIAPEKCNHFVDEIPQEWVDEGITPESMRKYGVKIDKFSNRIVYPVYDADFKLISYKGRTRFKNYKELKLPKYMNYSKIGGLDYFTGMKQAEPYIKQSGEIIIVEGIKSVMKIDGWGYHNVVSAETSNVSDQQLVLLIKMNVKSVCISFDKDVKLKTIRDQFKMLRRFCQLYVVIDKKNLLEPKMSPCDKGKDVWDKLYRERIRL